MVLRSVMPIREDWRRPDARPERMEETPSVMGKEEPLRPSATPERMLLARAESAETGAWLLLD